MKLSTVPELSSMSGSSIRVQLKWENITVVPKDQENNNATPPKKILNDVCGIVKPNQFLAIIGASGILNREFRCRKNQLNKLSK